MTQQSTETNVETVITPDKWKVGEAMMVGFFPNLFTGIRIGNRSYQLKKNNIENIYQVDWGIFCESDIVGAIDTEYKPKWINGHYPYWSVARYTWRYNKGEHDFPTETVKVRLYRKYPDLSFWMPIKSDYKEAGIITGKQVVNASIKYRPKPDNFARPIEIFEFPSEELVFCNILDTTIENYVIEHLERAGAFNE